jgi:hypothetical protein
MGVTFSVEGMTAVLVVDGETAGTSRSQRDRHHERRSPAISQVAGNGGHPRVGGVPVLELEAQRRGGLRLYD